MGIGFVFFRPIARIFDHPEPESKSLFTFFWGRLPALFLLVC